MCGLVFIDAFSTDYQHVLSYGNQLEIISTRDSDRKKNSNLNTVNFFHFQIDMLYFSHAVVSLSFNDDLCLTDISHSVLLEPVNALLTRDVLICLLLPRM